MSKIFANLLDYIFPRYCVLCECYLNCNSCYNFLCNKCADCLSFIGNDICQKCGSPFTANSLLFIDDNHLKICFKCKNTPPVYESSRSLILLNKLSKLLIHKFKYQNRQFLAEDMAKLCLHNPQFMEFINNAILVPVPLHWRKKFIREYNQSECFARSLAKYTQNSKVLTLLKKHKHTRPQVELLAEERASNLNGAFSLRKSAYKIEKSTKIIIIDDVLTTGTTLSQCAIVFKNNGFTNVHIASFART